MYSFFRALRTVAEELAHELAEFLSRRYPKVYSVTRHAPGSEKGNGWYGDGRIKEVTILPLGVTYNLDEDEPMKVAGLLCVLTRSHTLYGM